MTELLTAAQMRALEQAAIAAGDVTGLDLMERAGQGVVDAIFEEWPEFARKVDGAVEYLGSKQSGGVKAIVLCGPGNNGGDGFVVARLLAGLGWSVDVFLYGDAARLPADARVNYERWCEVGVVLPLLEHSEVHSDLIVDALFGVGLRREIEAFGALFLDMEDIVDRVPRIAGQAPEFPKIVAIDLPSGLCADSGRVFGAERAGERGAATAHLTVTFHAPKLGHFLKEGPELSGALKVCDIGLETLDIKTVGLCDHIHHSWLSKVQSDHKFNHGSALVLSGGSGRTGAARLAARGALRMGAGLVSVGVPPAAQMEVAGHVTAVMLKRVADADDLTEILQDRRLNALCLGPGLGLERARVLVPVALAAGRACVLDADALSAYADAPQTLFEMLHEGCVLTPHGGEFARLFPDIAKELNAPATQGPAYSKVDATRAAAAMAGCVVLFKGPDTVIAHPDGRCAVHSAAYDRAAPWLATAGAGDVLAGYITGLLARGFWPKQAAEVAAWLHVECARSFGPGLIAEDLPEELPKVLRAVGA